MLVRNQIQSTLIKLGVNIWRHYNISVFEAGTQISMTYLEGHWNMYLHSTFHNPYPMHIPSGSTSKNHHHQNQTALHRMMLIKAHQGLGVALGNIWPYSIPVQSLWLFVKKQWSACSWRVCSCATTLSIAWWTPIFLRVWCFGVVGQDRLILVLVGLFCCERALVHPDDEPVNWFMGQV
jgi:hypothetical protein